jgi:hypothetical protein
VYNEAFEVPHIWTTHLEMCDKRTEITIQWSNNKERMKRTGKFVIKIKVVMELHSIFKP